MYDTHHTHNVYNKQSKQGEEMTEIITIINQKGGVGKSTTAQALGQGLKELHNKKVLFIDLDAQGNLSSTLGVQPASATILEVLQQSCEPAKAIQKLESGDVIPSSPVLSTADMMFTSTGKEYILKEQLAQISNDYDYVIIDTPPALGILTVNALTASTSVVIPAQADTYSIQGISQLQTTINSVKKYCNPDLYIKGILLTRYNNRAVLNRNIAETLEEMAEGLNTRVFKAKIRDSIAVKEAQAMKQSLYKYAPKNNATIDYKDLINEVM